MIQINHPGNPQTIAKFNELNSRQQWVRYRYDWLHTPWARRRRMQFHPPEDESRLLVSLLYDGFNRKCAYCESRLSPEDATVNLYRPARHAQLKEDLRNPLDEHYYSWMAWEWENLFLSCRSCKNYLKAPVFPTENGERVDITRKRIGVKSLVANTLKERPLLINPCEKDVDPHVHLQFFEDGDVKPRDGSLRGQASIECYGLDRSDLKEMRRQAIDVLKSQWIEMINARLNPVSPTHSLSSDTQNVPLLVGMLSLCDDASEFAGMKRQLLLGWWEEMFYKLVGDATKINPLKSHFQAVQPTNMGLKKRENRGPSVVNVYVYGDVNGNIKIGGVEERNINTGGGAYIAGNVTVTGDFIARDQVIKQLWKLGV